MPKVLLLIFLAGRFVCAQSFVNFETAPVHPLALSPDGSILAVCNLPDSHVELFDLSTGTLRRLASIPTGLDPVTARFSPSGELWIANYISDSITIIDPKTRTIVATLQTADGPSDILFATNNCAYISHPSENAVHVWNVADRSPAGQIAIDGDRPRSMALSPDGWQIYVAMLESGNSSTIIAPVKFTDFAISPAPSAADLPDSPNRGINPAPNSGDTFFPPINPQIPSTNSAPKVGVIVRKQNGRWLDDNRGDWTEYISGTNSLLTGRVPGWDLADNDVAVITISNNSIRYVRNLMNICFDLSVHPQSGMIALVGTDAINEVRFEPNLQSIFVRTKLALVNPQDLSSTVSDLNPHLDYQTRAIPLTERRQSIGDPRGIAWSATGTRGYITGMGSDNIVAIDASGSRLGPVASLPEGPTGIIVDDQRNRLYVLSRFASRLLVLDAENLSAIQSVPLFDPTPPRIRSGRRHFYNTVNSGLGQVSCASCHVEGRFDRLAWDLGNPAGDLLSFTNRTDLFLLSSPVTYHPMKGPMVTQTLIDIIGHEPFHWRGDKDGIEQFNSTFVDLQGADQELTAEEMQEFEDFLATLTFTPNPFRNFDNSLKTNIILRGEYSLGRGTLPARAPLPPGNALRGSTKHFPTACLSCHLPLSGLGSDGRITNPFGPMPLGPNGERHLRVTSQPRSDNLFLKIPQLRDLPEKLGFTLRGPVSRSGFGFTHDGRVDTLTHFLQDGFGLTDDQDTADLIAFLYAFRGGDLKEGNRPSPPANDVSAGIGFQSFLTNSVLPERALLMMQHAQSITSRVDLIVRGFVAGQSRAWLMQTNHFLSDKSGLTNFIDQLLSFAHQATPLAFILVPRGSGPKALDRDGDSFFNADEIAVGSDPADPAVTPETTTPRLLSIEFMEGNISLNFFGRVGSSYRIEVRETFSSETPWNGIGQTITINQNPASWTTPWNPSAPAGFYRVTHIE